MKEFFTRFLRESVGADRSDEKLDSILKNQEEIKERLAASEARATEIARVLATLAIVQSSLVRELNAIVESTEKKKKPPPIVRKTGTDFTN